MTSPLQTIGAAATVFAARRIARRAVSSRVAASRERAAALAESGIDRAGDVADSSRRRVYEAIDALGPALRRAVDDIEVQTALRQVLEPGVAAASTLTARRRRSRQRWGLIGTAVAVAAVIALALVVRARQARTAADEDGAAETSA
ncbi:MAG: hypothetical protein ACLGG9_05495 [Thermoleophilia bacterium]